MGKNGNIFVKLHIEKDRNSGELTLNVCFDKDTPNFFKDKDAISWCPTIEEIDFVNEAFEMISSRKNRKHEKTDNENNKIDTHVEKESKNHSKTSQEESVTSKPKNENKDTERTLSDSEKKEMNEWFV